MFGQYEAISALGHGVIGNKQIHGRSVPPNDVEALGGAYLAPGMWEMRRGGFAGGPAILERGYA
jgi:hypothetical protein